MNISRSSWQTVSKPVPEVETLIETSVEEVLSSSAALLAERVSLVNRLVEALEQDSAWVDMYGVSGELNVPEVFGELGEADEPLSRVIKVCISMWSPVFSLTSRLAFA